MLLAFLILVFLLVVLLLLPFEVEVDTERGVYRTAWRGIFALRGSTASGKWEWYYRIFFFENKWQPEPGKTDKPVKAEEPVKKAGRKGKLAMSPRKILRLAVRLLGTFRMKRLRINWDTDDFALNARLYPLFLLLSNEKRELAINFTGKQELAIHLQIHPYRLVWAFLRVFFSR